MKPGDTLSGSFVVDKNQEAVSSMRLVYPVPPKSAVKKGSDDGGSKDGDDKDDDEEATLNKTIFEAKLKHLSSIRSKDADDYKTLADALKEENPSSIPLLSELLLFAQKRPLPSSESNENEWRAKQIQHVYDDTKSTNGGPIDDAILAQYFGLNQPDEDDLKDDKEAKKLKKEMSEQRKFLRSILFARSKILAEKAVEDEASLDAFDESVKDMKKWVASNGSGLTEEDDKVQLQIVLSRHARLCQDKKATALSILLKAKKDFSGGSHKQIANELVIVYRSFEGMEMGHLVDNSNDEIFNCFPVVSTPL